MEKIFSFEEKNIAYTITDTHKKPCVVLLHGFAETAAIWQHQITYLQNDYNIIAPTLGGHWNIIDTYADAVHALLQHEQIAQAFIFGHSMGGYIALSFVAQYTPAVLGYGLIHSTALADNETKKQQRKNAIKTMEAYGAAVFLKNTIPNLFTTAYKKEHTNMIDEIIAASQCFHTQDLQNYYRAMMNRRDSTHVLRKHPNALLIVGSEDTAAPLNDLQTQAAQALQAHLVVVDNVGHMGFVENPSAVNTALKKYLRQYAQA